jgi:hypothetical protein
VYQLNSIDYEFYKDINSHNSIVGNVAILNNETNQNIKNKVIQNIKNNINSSIIHSYKIVPSPINGDYPFLVKDKKINLDNHVFEHHSDGSGDQLNEIFKKIISSCLNPNIPLWQTDIVYNINEKKDTAIIRRYHHCLGDSDAHAMVHDLLFDNYKKIKIKQYQKVNKTQSYIDHFCKIIKSYLLLAYGFIFKKNKCTKNYKIDKKQIYKGTFRSKKHKQNNVSFFSYDVSSIEKILKDKKITKLDLCLYASSCLYESLLPNLEDKTILSMFPISYRNKKSKQYKNMATTVKINFYLNEKDKIKRLFFIKEEIRDKIKIAKNGPHIIYDRAFNTDPRIKKFKRNWDIFNKANWHNRKKIYSKDKNPSTISTTTSFRTAQMQDLGIDNMFVQNVYNFSMISKTVASVGCSITYRFYGNKINVGIIHSTELYPDYKIFESIFKKCMKDLEKNLKTL